MNHQGFLVSCKEMKCIYSKNKSLHSQFITVIFMKGFPFTPNKIRGDTVGEEDILIFSVSGYLSLTKTACHML